MAELNDYSGPFDPRLTFYDLSKDFLLRLIRVWQFAWIELEGGWEEEVEKRYGVHVAMGCDLQMWLQCADLCNTKYVRIARIPMKNAVDCLKALQLPLDNTMGAVYPTSQEIIDENHAIVTVTKCPSLEFYEKSAPHRIVPMCQIVEPPLIDRYKVSREVQLTATRLPPRQGPDDVACQWDYRMPAPEGTRVRSKEEVVDETPDPPEVDDLSGPYYPHLTHARFSKPFLIKMMHAWQYAWLVMNDGYYATVRMRFGSDVADACELGAWARVAEKINRTKMRFARAAGIEPKKVTDSLKLLQLSMDSTMGYFPAEYDVRGPNHVIVRIGKGRTPDYLDNAPIPRTPPMYHEGGIPIMERYLVNPEIKVTPLRLPPRNEHDDVDCEWDLRR
jgi:hypothetical protein